MIIRQFKEKDAEQASTMIIDCLENVNSRDYNPSIIEERKAKNTPEALVEKSKSRTILVAEESGKIYGTVSIDGDEIKTMFVNPTFHKHGIGKKLLTSAEKILAAKGIKKSILGASFTAIGFYEKMGYKRVKSTKVPTSYGVLMEKEL